MRRSWPATVGAPGAGNGPGRVRGHDDAHTLGSRRVAVPVLTAVLLAAGCGSSSDSGTVVKDASPRCAKVKKLAPAAGKPTTVEVPPRPATTLVQQDLKPGTGETAVDGKQLTVDFVGISCTSGEEFDASWGKGKPDPKTKKPGDKPARVRARQVARSSRVGTRGSRA